MIKFKNAQDAFDFYYNFISLNGFELSNNKAIFNEGFMIENPLDNKINSSFRKWNQEYAEAEWKWYLSGSSNVDTLKDIYGFIPTVWKKMVDNNNCVNSNYGCQWMKGNQIDYVVNELRKNRESRRASISIYDAKNRWNFDNDTPCTYAINFNILNDKLNMSVMMRSNDLWYGFCNDQYCFSKLQELISKKLSIEVGTYFHFTNNLHIYNNFLNKKTK